MTTVILAPHADRGIDCLSSARELLSRGDADRALDEARRAVRAIEQYGQELRLSQVYAHLESPA